MREVLVPSALLRFGKMQKFALVRKAGFARIEQFCSLRHSQNTARASKFVPRPNHNSVRVSRAYGYQCIHAQTISPFVFRGRTVTSASMPNHKSVRVSRAYGYQCIHAQTIIPFVFRKRGVTPDDGLTGPQRRTLLRLSAAKQPAALRDASDWPIVAQVIMEPSRNSAGRSSRCEGSLCWAAALLQLSIWML